MTCEMEFGLENPTSWMTVKLVCGHVCISTKVYVYDKEEDIFFSQFMEVGKFNET